MTCGGRVPLPVPRPRETAVRAIKKADVQGRYGAPEHPASLVRVVRPRGLGTGHRGTSRSTGCPPPCLARRGRKAQGQLTPNQGRGPVRSPARRGRPRQRVLAAPRRPRLATRWSPPARCGSGGGGACSARCLLTAACSGGASLERRAAASAGSVRRLFGSRSRALRRGAASNTLAATIAGSMPTAVANPGSGSDWLGRGRRIGRQAGASAVIAATSVAGNSSAAGSAVGVRDRRRRPRPPPRLPAVPRRAAAVAAVGGRLWLGDHRDAGHGGAGPGTADRGRGRVRGLGRGRVAGRGRDEGRGCRVGGRDGTTGTSAGVSSTRTAVAKAVPAEVLRRVRRLSLPSVPVAPLPPTASDCAVTARTTSDRGASDWGASAGAVPASRSAGGAGRGDVPRVAVIVAAAVTAAAVAVSGPGVA